MIRIFQCGSTDKHTYTLRNTKVATIYKDGNISVLSSETTIKIASIPQNIIVENTSLKVGQTKKINYEVNLADAIYIKVIGIVPMKM